MRKFRTMFAYMDDDSRYIPEDSGECIVQPDLDLSVKEIMERWVRNQPLDNVARNGSFIHEGAADEDLPDEVFDADDIDLMDMVEAEEYLATRNHVAQATPAVPPAEPKASDAGAAAKPAEQASQQAGEGEAVG